MPRVTITVKVKDSGLIEAYRALLADFPKRTIPAIHSAVNRFRKRTLFQRLRAEPARPTYPIKWKSEQQRRAYFASNGFGRGIPTKRSHDLSKGWKTKTIPVADNIPQISITNPVSYRKFVTGRYQQRMHKGRWFNERALFKQARIELAGEVETALLELMYSVEGK